jgi:hypothetical protein
MSTTLSIAERERILELARAARLERALAALAGVGGAFDPAMATVR